MRAFPGLEQLYCQFTFTFLPSISKSGMINGNKKAYYRHVMPFIYQKILSGFSYSQKRRDPMHVGRKAQKREKKAMSVSLYGNLFFVIVEIVMAIYTSSQAVLLDAIYDGVEFCMLLPSLFLIPLLYKPSNEKHPFGYMQIESMFVVVKGITMTGVTVGLILNNIEIMIHGGRKVAFDTIAWFELFAFFLGITVSIYLKYKNRLMDSPLITMEMEGWEIDSIASFGMAIAFFLPVLLPFPWFRPITPYLDQIITVTLSIFMLPTPIKTVITGLRDLFLIPPEEETVDEIKETIEPVLNAYGYKKLYYDILRTGRKLWISVYITFDKDLVSITRFKIVQNFCIQALAKKYTDFYFELLPDIVFTTDDEALTNHIVNQSEEVDQNAKFAD